MFKKTTDLGDEGTPNKELYLLTHSWPYKPSEKNMPTNIASSYFQIKLKFLHNYFIFTDEHTWREIHKFSRVTIDGCLKRKEGTVTKAHIYSFQRLDLNLMTQIQTQPWKYRTFKLNTIQPKLATPLTSSSCQNCVRSCLFLYRLFSTD